MLWEVGNGDVCVVCHSLLDGLAHAILTSPPERAAEIRKELSDEAWERLQARVRRRLPRQLRVGPVNVDTVVGLYLDRDPTYGPRNIAKLSGLPEGSVHKALQARSFPERQEKVA
jgi:hypothetical protein